MKTVEWQNFFGEQQRTHGKTVFSVAELANAARTTSHVVNTELGRLMKRGLLTRYAHGQYGTCPQVNPEELVTAVDPGAYITGFYALFQAQMVTQVPVEITCFTNRRHNRKPDRPATAARLRFIQVPAEQALCDFVWLNVREGLAPDSLVTFRNLERLNLRRLARIAQNYPDNVVRSVNALTANVRQSAPHFSRMYS